MKNIISAQLTTDNAVEDIDDKIAMDPEEVAEFLGTHWEQLTAILRRYGSWHDAQEALAELAGKILGAANGYGVELKFLGDPFKTPRSQGGWIGWLLWQARSRLEVIQQRDKRWYYNNAVNSTVTCEELAEYGESVDCELSPMESSFVGGVNRGDGPGNFGEDAETSPDGNSRDARYFDGYSKWRAEEEKKNLRIRSFVVEEEDRHLHNYIPRPGDYLDDAIANEAAPAAFEQVCKECNVSRRDAAVFYRTRIERENCEEVARDYKITANNAFQIAHRVGTLMKTFGPKIFAVIRARAFGRL